MMSTLRGLGSAVGEYVGDGQGETEAIVSLSSPSVDIDFVGAELGINDQSLDETEEDSSDDAHPLLFLFDCETTGLSIYTDHITDIAAKVISSPVPLTSPTFSSLVKTLKRIPSKGLCIKFLFPVLYLYNSY